MYKKITLLVILLLTLTTVTSPVFGSETVEYLHEHDQPFLEEEVVYEPWETLNEDITFIDANDVKPTPPMKGRASTFAAPTTVDVGSLVSGGSVTIQPIWVWKWNATQHYQQDVISGKTQSAVNHTFKLIGENNCDVRKASAYQQCTYANCGYSVTVAKLAHTPATSTYNYNGWNTHYIGCSSCGQWHSSHAIPFGTEHGRTGVCSVCSQTVTITTQHNGYQGTCNLCGIRFKGTLSVDYSNFNASTGGYLLASVERYPGLSVSTAPYTGNHSGTQGTIPTVYGTLHSTTSTHWIYRINLPVNTDKLMQDIYGLRVACTWNGLAAGNYTTNLIDKNLSPDTVAPTLKSASVSYQKHTSGYWSNRATVTATFNEAWANLVSIAMYDGNTEVAPYASAKDNGNGTFTATFDVAAEALAAGKTFQLRAKDRVGNIGTGNLAMQQLDSRPPVYATLPDMQSTWAKSKSFTMTTTDSGIGDVSLAFGLQSDYAKATKNGTTYTRDYVLTGDVYSVVNIPLFAKDGIDNTGTATLPVNRIDNTRPTITSVTKASGVNPTSRLYTVVANDNHPTKGAGSGPSQYAVTQTNVEPTSGWQSSASFSITKKGTYYFWVKDLAGNVSLSSKQTETDINPIVTFPTAGEITYGDTIDASTLTGQNIVTAGTFKFAEPTTTPDVSKNGVTHQMIFTPANTAEHNIVTKDVPVYVKRKPVTITGVTAIDKVYDGTTAVGVNKDSSTIVGNIDGAELITDISNATATATDTEVGTHQAYFNGVVLSGSAASNYTLTAQPAMTTVTITPRQLEASKPEVILNKVYDGTPEAKVEAGELLNTVNNDDVNVHVDDAKYNSTNTRTARTITVVYGIEGADATNYIAPQVETFSGKIIKDEPEVVWPTLPPLTYGQTLASLDLSSGQGDGYFTWSIPGYKPTVAENGTPVQLTFYPYDDENYLTLSKMLTLTVLPRPIYVSGITASSKVYDSTTAAEIDLTNVDFQGNLDGENLKLNLSSAVGSFVNKEVAEDKDVLISGIVLVGVSAPNYIIQEVENAKASISPLQLETEDPAVDTDKEYDGTSTATVSAGQLANAILGDDLVLIASAEYNSKDITQATHITVTYSLSGSDSGNYTAPAQALIPL